jgi:hypothetical protein
MGNMASLTYKDRLVIVTADPDKNTGAWAVRIEISHTIKPGKHFSSLKEAEDFGVQFAKDYIDIRTERGKFQT